MDNSACIIGVDVSRDYLDVCAWPGMMQERFYNNSAGFEDLLAWSTDRAVKLFAVDHTGRLSRTFVNFLRDHGERVALVDGRRARAFSTVIQQQAKTDRLDAVLIAKFASMLSVEPSNIPSDDEQELQDLSSRIYQLTKFKTQDKLREANLSCRYIKESVERHQNFLKEEIQVLQSVVDQRIDSCVEWRRRRDIILSFPGCGQGTMRIMIAHLPELGRISGKELSSLVGLAPLASESGTIVRKRRIRGGRKIVRSALFMASISGCRLNPVLTEFYQRLLSRGRPRLVARTASMRKLLIILNAMVKNDEFWSSERRS